MISANVTVYLKVLQLSDSRFLECFHTAMMVHHCFEAVHIFGRQKMIDDTKTLICEGVRNLIDVTFRPVHPFFKVQCSLALMFFNFTLQCVDVNTAIENRRANLHILLNKPLDKQTCNAELFRTEPLVESLFFKPFDKSAVEYFHTVLVEMAVVIKV